MYERFLWHVREAARTDTAGEATSTRARKAARLAEHARVLAGGWSERALGTLVRVGPDDGLKEPRERLLDTLGAGAASTLAARAFECGIGQRLDEGAPQWRNAARTLALDWMDAHGGAARWVRALERATTLSARTDPCMLAGARLRALAGLSEGAWKRIEAEALGLRRAALGEAPVAALEGDRAQWMGAVARGRLAALGCERKVDASALAERAKAWPWPTAEPPLGILALLAGQAELGSATAWAGAERLERQPEMVRKTVQAHASTERASAHLRREVEREAARMRGLIEREARTWTRAQGHDAEMDEIVRRRWRAARATLGGGTLATPTPIACCARVGWRMTYSSPAAVAAGAQMAQSSGGEDAAVIATWAYAAVVRESARAAGCEGTVFLTPWTGTRLGPQGRETLVQICAESRTRWNARRYEALVGTFAARGERE